MAYTILRTNGSLLTNIADNTLNTNSTPLSLPGRNYASYGQVVDTNFVHQLENFANVTPPANALKGQLWFNTTNNSLYVCPTDGQANAALWIPILTPNNISNLTVDNLTANANITTNNALITNDLDSNVISTNYLTVNVSANINSANLQGATVANSITTNNITTGSNTTAGTLTGNWSLNGALTSNGNVSASGVKTDNYYYANGTPISFDGTYGDSNVAAFLPTYIGTVGDPGSSTVFNGRTLSTGSNLTTGAIIGDWTLSTGSKINGLSGIDGANITGTVANAAFAANANIANTVRVNAQPNITSVGTLTSLVVTGNITSGNANLGNAVNANFFIGSGNNLSNIQAANVTGTVTNATTAITVSASAQPSITSVGTLTSLGVAGNTTSGNVSTGRLTATGDVAFSGVNIALGSNSAVRITGGSAGDVLSTDGAGTLSWVPTGTATTAQTVTGNNQSNINQVGILTSLAVTGNVIAGNVYANAGTIGASLLRGTLTTTAQPNVVSLGTLTGLTVSGNATFTGPVVNLGTVGNLRITGGTNGQVLSTNGTGVVSWGPVATASTAETVTGNAQSNITSVGTLTSLTVSGNITSSSGRFIGNGAGLTSIPASSIVGTVSSASTATNATNAGTAGIANSVAWTNVSGRPTNLSDFINGPGYITTPFPSGTKMLFAQIYAPVGWTRITTYDNHALRVITGSAGTGNITTSGGTVDFTTAFNNQSTSGAVGGTALTVAQMPSHTHGVTDPGHTHGVTDPGHNHIYQQYLTKVRGDDNNDVLAYNSTTPLDTSTSTTGISINSSTTGVTLSTTGLGSTHTHAFSGSSINLAVKYVDVIIAAKD